MIPEIGVQAARVHRRWDDAGQPRGVTDCIPVQQTAEHIGQLHPGIFICNADGTGNNRGRQNLFAVVDVLPERHLFRVTVPEHVIVEYLRNNTGINLALGAAVQIQVLPIIRGMPHNVVSLAADRPVLMPVDRAFLHQAGNIVDTPVCKFCKAREIGLFVHVGHRQLGALLGVVLVQQVNNAFWAGDSHAGQVVGHQVVGQVAPVGLNLVGQMQDKRGPKLCQLFGPLKCRLHLGVGLGVYAAVVGLTVIVGLQDFGFMDLVHVNALALFQGPGLVRHGVRIAKIDLAHMVCPVVAGNLQALHGRIIRADRENGAAQNLADRFGVVVGAGQQRGLRDRHKTRRIHDGRRGFLPGRLLVDLGQNCGNVRKIHTKRHIILPPVHTWDQ